jgi:hypothetical protein
MSRLFCANDVAYPLPVLGVRSTPFAGAWGKVYSICLLVGKCPQKHYIILQF